MQRLVNLSAINEQLCCMLCSGYLVDATTLVECSHSFCRTCLFKYLADSYDCPKCGTEIHKTKPLEYTRSDPVLQEVVYKLVPDLYASEQKRKKAYAQGEKSENDEEDEHVMITLKYFRGTSRVEKTKTENVLLMFPTRYLCCKANMPVSILKKFIQYKFDIACDIFDIDLWRGDETLLDHLTLKQLVQIFGLYRELKPLELHYSLYPKLKPDPLSSKEPLNKPIPNNAIPVKAYNTPMELDEPKEEGSSVVNGTNGNTESPPGDNIDITLPTDENKTSEQDQSPDSASIESTSGNVQLNTETNITCEMTKSSQSAVVLMTNNISSADQNEVPDESNDVFMSHDE